MADPSDFTTQALDIIEKYIKPQSHLLVMERIHRNLFDEDLEFHRWQDVIDEYSGIEWDPELLRKFAKQSKQIVEQGTARISESYFHISFPKSLDAEDLFDEFDRNPYEPDAPPDRREGFEYTYDDDYIYGNYVYVDVDINITTHGEVQNLVSEGTLPFRIDLEDSLLILESTKVTDVQKIKSVIRNTTNLGIRVAPLSNQIDIGEFKQSLGEYDDELDIYVNSATLENDDQGPEVEQKSLELKGPDISEQNVLDNHLEEEWSLVGFSFTCDYKGDLFKITIRLSNVMKYIKIENVYVFTPRNRRRTVGSKSGNSIRNP
ncbi:hypothetical protein [Natrinema pallidum]|uniref:hypothetical protein n=1 Tax=Natrinema pallidum TaxID=69527 RepID=UPI001267FA3F|nr:hypothetical protein [Natrinema pallidum]